MSRLWRAKKCYRGDTSPRERLLDLAGQTERAVSGPSGANSFSRNCNSPGIEPDTSPRQNKNKEYSIWRAHQAQQELTQIAEFHKQLTLPNGEVTKLYRDCTRYLSATKPQILQAGETKLSRDCTRYLNSMKIQSLQAGEATKLSRD